MLQEALKAKVEHQTQSMEGGNAYPNQVFSTTPGARINTAQQNQQGVAAGDLLGIDNDELHLKSKSNQPKKNPDSFSTSWFFC